MHTLTYGGNVEYDKRNNDITSAKVSNAAPWSHRCPLEHKIKPDHKQCISCGEMN